MLGECLLFTWLDAGIFGSDLRLEGDDLALGCSNGEPSSERVPEQGPRAGWQSGPCSEADCQPFCVFSLSFLI